MPTSTVDRMFIATKVNAPSVGAANALFRHEFLEILLRISNVKFKDTGVVSTFAEALQIMLDEILEKYAVKPWQIFRD